MAKYMRGGGKKVKEMAGEDKLPRMEVYTMVNGLITNKKGLESALGKMVTATKVNGKLTKDTAKASTPCKTETHTTAVSLTMPSMG